MDPIKPNSSTENNTKNVGDFIERSNKVKRKIARGIINNSGIFVGVFIVFVVIVVFTTDIKLTSALEWAALGLAFFVLLLCSYSMYVNCADSGTRAGKQSSTYIEASDHYDELKNEVVEKKIHGRLPEFCRHFIDEELHNARSAILTDVGITYEQFKESYVGKDKATLEKDTTLSKAQIDAIIAANKIKPIHLTPEMILKRGRGSAQRSPLGVKPTTKKSIKFGVKFVKVFITSALTSIIVLDIVINPSWATFAACLLKLFPVVLNGFMGYKMGYENIVVDTVNYMTDQADLLQQFVHYVEQNPTPEAFIVEAEEVVTEAEAPPETAAAETTN